MTNKHTTEVETKGLISLKTYNELRNVFLDHPEVGLKATFRDKMDFFWDVGSDTVEAFVRCRYDENGKKPTWLIKIQEGTFNKRTEIDLPIGKASHMSRHHDYAITGSGTIWTHNKTGCTISLYYVNELKQHFIEIESDMRQMNHVYHCERSLDMGRFPVEDSQKSLFAMIKEKSLTKR